MAVATRTWTTNTTNIDATAFGEVSKTTFVFDPAVTVGNGDTLTITTTTTTSGGEWWPTDPDMTDWPSDDIIDHYARQLAKRRPA